MARRAGSAVAVIRRFSIPSDPDMVVGGATPSGNVSVVALLTAVASEAPSPHLWTMPRGAGPERTAVEVDTITTEQAGLMAARDEEMWKLVQTSELPLVLTRLSDFTIQEATTAYLDQIDVSPDELLGHSVFNLMDAAERPRAREALQALADGTIDFYRTYRPLSLARTHRAGVYVWSHAIDFGQRRYALTQVRATNEPTESPLVESLGYEPTKIAIGVMDGEGIVTSVSNDVDDVIGITADRLIGSELLTRDQHDLWSRFHTAQPSHGGCSMALSYSPPSPLPDTGRVRCLLVCLAGSASYCFILTQEPAAHIPTDQARTAELEQHLRRIAQEVQASGVIEGMGTIPDPARFPQLRTLNARQWDVLTRLLRGDRVGAIADEMFLSASAVRNHLSELFRRFDVHSQSELLALLRS
jgi:DNA-binding CsgD family transcriptional regulator